MENETPYHLQGKKIAILEDSDFQRGWFEGLIEESGGIALSSGSVIDFRKVMAEGGIEGIIADVILPGEINGIRAAIEAVEKYQEQGYPVPRVCIVSEKPILSPEPRAELIEYRGDVRALGLLVEHPRFVCKKGLTKGEIREKILSYFADPEAKPLPSIYHPRPIV